MGGTEKTEAIINNMIADFKTLGMIVQRDTSLGIYTITAQSPVETTLGASAKIYGWVALGNFLEGVKFAVGLEGYTGEDMYKWMDRSKG